MKRLTVLLASAAALAILISPAGAQKKPIQLTAIQFVNLGNPNEFGLHLVADMVNKAAKGELAIKIVGGPESTPGRQQPEAVRTGAIDIAVVPGSWYKSMVPVTSLLFMSLLEPPKERKSGLYDFYVEEHARAGLRYIGDAGFAGGFYFFSREPIHNIEGLKGKRFRHSPAYPFFPAFGIKPVTAAHSDIYPGLERNVFDGLAINLTNFIKLRLYEVCKYVVGPNFYDHTALPLIMNLAKFNSLPQHLQNVILDSMQKAEPLIAEKSDSIQEENWKTLKANGVKHIQWSAEENKAFLDIVNQVTWEVAEKKIKPSKLEKIKKMMGY